MRVPATSANLGPGFDVLGLALGLHDEVEVAVTPGGLSIEVSGEGAAEVADADEKHLVVRAMRVGFDDLGVAQPPGLALRCVNRIPHGRGLGSSAAAIVAGLLAARALAGASLDPDAVLPLANELEGHPDNVAPCLFGGLTIAWVTGYAARAIRLEPLPTVRPVAFIAPEPVSTKVARDLLPAERAARRRGAERGPGGAARRRAHRPSRRAARRLRRPAAPGLPGARHARHARPGRPAARGRGARGHLGRGPVGAGVPDRRRRSARTRLGEAGFNRAEKRVFNGA